MPTHEPKPYIRAQSTQYLLRQMAIESDIRKIRLIAAELKRRGVNAPC